MTRPSKTSSPIQVSRAPRTTALLLVLSAVAGSSPSPAQFSRPGMDKASLQLLVDRTAYASGETVGLAAQVTVEETWHVQAHEPSFEYLIPTVLELDWPEAWAEPPEAEVTYPTAILWQSTFEADPLAVYEGTFPIFAHFAVPESVAEGEVEIGARLRYQACDDRVCLPPTTATGVVRLSVGEGGTEIRSDVFAAADEGTAGPPSGAGGGLWWMLVLGVLGGLILNAMPCVLPVVSLKVFSLVKTATLGRRETVLGALATAAGIVISFWGLALMAILAKNAGEAIGWGVQFQNPGFVAFLTLVVVLFALNLWGLFEIPLPQFLARAADGRPRQGYFGHFWWGAFATLMATPCSAPFLGSAVSFGLSQRSVTIFAIFSAIAFGMALPYFLLAVAPGAAAVLPKPGAWMETVRGVMGFFLAATAIWLLFVLAAQIDPVRLAFFELGLVVLGFFAWIYGRTLSRPNWHRIAALGLLATSVGILVLATRAEPRAGGGGEVATRLISWQPWDRAKAEALANEGNLVFVDVTADWCATCKFNERLVLETETVAGLFESHGVIAMRADWTNRNDEITSYLQAFGRYGIPFYALYYPGGDPMVFSELLSKSAIVDAIERAVAARGGTVASLEPAD